VADATEGWEWKQIQFAPCPQCGQDPAHFAREEFSAVAIDTAGSWAVFLVHTDDDWLRASPAPEVWSPIQYGLHVRDMLRVFGDRVVRAVDEDNPEVSWFDPGPEGRRQYNLIEAHIVASAIGEQAERLSEILSGLTDGDWDRTVMRDGVDRFTVTGLACFAVHEAHHHLLDATGELAERLRT
jgi:hypothetical protein